MHSNEWPCKFFTYNYYIFIYWAYWDCSATLYDHCRLSVHIVVPKLHHPIVATSVVTSSWVGVQCKFSYWTASLWDKHGFEEHAT